MLSYAWGTLFWKGFHTIASAWSKTRAATANFWQASPPQWLPHNPGSAAAAFYSAKSRYSFIYFWFDPFQRLGQFLWQFFRWCLGGIETKKNSSEIFLPLCYTESRVHMKTYFKTVYLNLKSNFAFSRVHPGWRWKEITL